jgi:hypothetical protein
MFGQGFRFEKTNKDPEKTREVSRLYSTEKSCPAGIDLFLKSTLRVIKLKIV